MFYYPAVLKRHSGCFATIWLVATKGIRVPRRDFLKVNVVNTCGDIMSYVLEQVPPPWPGLPRPRFSLYLSSQLQYGVVIVYHRQCAILLAELQAVVVRLVKQRTSQKINMDDQSRQALDFPDALSLLEETEGAPDPLFGVMQDTMPSPNTLIQRGQEHLRASSPDHVDQTSPSAPAAALESDTTASPDMITLRETEPVTIPPPEFEGEELVSQLPDTLDFLFSQSDNFPEGDLETERDEVTPGEGEREMERGGQEGDLEKERTKDLTGSTTELQPTTLFSEDTMLLPQEEPGLSVEKSGPPTDQLTPVSVGLPTPPSAAEKRKRPSPELEDAPQVRTRKGKKRQLIFFDPETQLSPEVLQQQIDNPRINTRPPVLPLPPSHRMPSAAELLNNPCTALPAEVLFLWRQAATVTPVPGSDLQAGERGPESTDSEREREREMAEVAEREEERREELSPQEVPRDVAESEMLNISDHSSLPLEASGQRDACREISPVFTPRERSPVSRSIVSLQDIPEVQERTAAESPGLQPELPEHRVAPGLFQSLLAPEVDRRTVSHLFQRLLEDLSAQRLRAEQDEPYGDIAIFPGRHHEDEGLTL